VHLFNISHKLRISIDIFWNCKSTAVLAWLLDKFEQSLWLNRCWKWISRSQPHVPVLFSSPKLSILWANSMQMTSGFYMTGKNSVDTHFCKQLVSDFKSFPTHFISPHLQVYQGRQKLAPNPKTWQNTCCHGEL